MLSRAGASPSGVLDHGEVRESKMLREIIAIVLEGAAHFVWTRLHGRLARMATTLLTDVPVLAGNWAATFRDPAPDGVELLKVQVQLRQFGRNLRGCGHIVDHPGDSFRFQGTLKRNVFFGSFQRKDAHVLAGTGAFVLKVSPDSRRMAGSCMWFDGLLDDVWTSEYRWGRLGGPIGR